jgi:hypothetical protein
MKTFLWVEMEYEFIAVNAETLEQAIEIGKAEAEADYKRQVEEQVEFYKDRTGTFKMERPEIEKRCRQYADDRLRQFTDEPVILEMGQAKIIYHANE